MRMILCYIQLIEKDQVISVIQKCHIFLNIIKFLVRVKWGGDPKILLNLYKALIISRLEYCAFLFNFMPYNLQYKLNSI